MNRKALLAGLALLTAGCGEMRVEDALRELRGPAYSRSVETDYHSVQIQYVPRALGLLGASGVDGSTRLTRKLLDSLAAGQAAGGLVFILRVQPRDTSEEKGLENDLVYGRANGYATYQEASQAFMFGLKEKIWVETGGKKYPLLQYHMENSWGMNPGRTFVLTFPGPAAEAPRGNMHLQVVLDDIVPGLAGKKFEWKLPLGKYDALI